MPTRYTLQAFQADYPDDATCLAAILARRVGPKPICPACHRQTRYFRLRKRRAYSCQWCGAHVYPCVGTPFEKSRTPLTKWFTAMYLFTTTRHGVAAKELERQLGVTYKCAWRMAHAIRTMMEDPAGASLSGAVEVDETYIGGKRRGTRGRGAAGKTPVLGLQARQGAVRTHVVPDTARATLEPIVAATVAPGAVVHTDEWTAYRRLAALGYRHRTVTHGRGQWADRGSHTNTLEGYWSQIKRSIRGTHVAVSPQHLPKYLAEFAFRRNRRHAPHLLFAQLLDQLLPAPDPVAPSA